MSEMRRYPIGVQRFAWVRERDLVYVDKTRYVWDMASGGVKYYFLSRPRRFGKTMLVSTLEAYFQGRRELFEGLALGELEREWTVHPVIRLDLSSVKATDEEGLHLALDMALSRCERPYGVEGGGTAYGPRLERLIRAAREQAGEDAVVLVDEYDAPLLTVLHDDATLRRFREVMRDLYSPLKACEDLLRFVFLTGITKFSQLSIFSELNNLNNVSMDVDYAAVCGITEDELACYLASDVERLADSMGMSPEEVTGALRDRYDGYRFTRSPVSVYNPFSLVQALAKRDLGNYWFGSGTPTSLVRLISSGRVSVPSLEGTRATAATFDAPTEASATPVAFLYQSGYLTIKDYEPVTGTYTLAIPNREVSEGLYRALLPAYAPVGDVERDTFLDSFIRAFFLDDDADSALRQLRSFLASIPYELSNKSERDVQTVLFIVFKLVGARIACEVRTATGRIDATVRSRTTLYVIELKYGRSAAEAVAQIDDRGYLIPWEAEAGRGDLRVVKVGASFDPDQRTLDEGWIVEEV